MNRTLHASCRLTIALSILFAASAYAQTTNYFVDFEGASETKTAYASGSVTLSGLQWNLTEALIGTSASDRKNGLRSARLRTNEVAVMTMLEDITNGAGVVSFLHAKYGSDGDSAVALDYSTDAGGSWVNAGTVTVTSTALTPYSTNVNQTGNVRLRIRKTAGTASQRPNVDDILVLSPHSGPPVIETNVQFTAASDSIGEAGGAYTVTVYKTLASGNVSGQVQLGGTAANPTDYTISTTNFTMNGTVTSATFVITIDDDSATESAETVTLTLTNVTGGTIATPSVFTLTITDNDAPPVTGEGILSFRFNTTPYLPVTTNDAGITVSIMSLTSGTIETNITTGTYFQDEPYIEETGGWTAASQEVAKAFQFTVTPDAGVTVTITGISFRAYATAAGPSAFGASIDGAAVFSANMPDATLQVVSNTFAPVVKNSPFVVQIQGWTNGSRTASGAGVLRLDDVVLFGTIDTGGGGYSAEQQDYIVTHWGSVGAYTGDAADDDGDGYLNVEEFIAGTIPVPPSGAASYFRQAAISNAVTPFVVFPSVTGRTYRLWSAPSFDSPQSWSNVAGPAAGTGGNITLSDGIATNIGRYRLTVEMTSP